MLNVATALYHKLTALDAKVGGSFLTIQGRRFGISKLTSVHPFAHFDFYNLVFDKELTQQFSAVPPQDAMGAINQCILWLNSQVESEDFSPEQAQLAQTHTVAVDVKTGEYFLWSNHEQRISDWSVKAYFERFTSKQTNDLKFNSRLSRVVFDPYRGLDKIWEEQYEGNQVVAYNAYRPPRWQQVNFTEEMGQKMEVYPELFMFILQGLIPDPVHQALVLDWLALAVFDRPNGFLLLRGARGNGKTTFIYLIYHLVGNFLNARKGVVTDFNADIRNKRIIGMSDNPIIGTREGNLTRKSFTDPITTFNEKHVQTTVSEKQHASLVISSNPSEQFYVEHDERKIVSPNLTPHSVNDWSTPEIGDWVSHFGKVEGELPETHLQFLREIGAGLFSRFTQARPSPDIQLHAGHFWDDVLKSLTSFKRFVLQRCLFPTDEDLKLEYDIVRSDYALEPQKGGHIETWHSIRSWALADFAWQGKRICTHAEERDKLLFINPEVIVQMNT